MFVEPIAKEFFAPAERHTMYTAPPERMRIVDEILQTFRSYRSEIRATACKNADGCTSESATISPLSERDPR